MSLILYHFPPSPPSRFALMVAKALGLDIDVKIIDLFRKEQLKPDFIKINLQHTVPTLVDGDFTLWEGKAIASYLVRTYGNDDSLYPKDVKKRAIVDQRLQFEVGTLNPRIRAIFFPVLFLGEIKVSEDKKASLNEALEFLNVFLDGQNFVAGNQLTIADCACAASISTIVSVDWDISPYANISTWIARCALEIPHYNETNQIGANAFAQAIKAKLAPGQI